MLISRKERPVARIANEASSHIFIFLSILLVISRIPLNENASPIYFFLFTLIVVSIAFLFAEGLKTSFAVLASIGIFCTLISVWAFLTRHIYSPGFDGYAYHLSAVWDIAAGWNPLLSPHNNIWVDSYPNGYWTLQSYVVAMTGLLMSGQALVVGLMLAVALLSYGFFLEHCGPKLPRYPRITATIFAGVLVANPVVIGQLLTQYVDAPLYLFGAALTLFLLSDTLSSNRLARIGAIACIILMVNTKTAALYYTPLIVFGGLVAELALRHTDKSFLRRMYLWIRSKGLLFGFTFIFGVMAIGYKPYVTNVLDHGQPLYPSVDKIMKGNEPSNMIPLSAPMKFIYGIFARTDHSNWPIDEPIELKVPGTFKLFEFKFLRFDTRRGGFGPFFSLTLLSAIAAYAVCRVAGRRNSSNNWHREGDSFALFGSTLIAASMFFPESWWARYIPFTWLSVLLFSIAALNLTSKGFAHAFSRFLLVIVALSFLGCILASGLGAIREGIQLHKRTEKIDFIAQFPKVKLLMFYDPPTYQDFQSSSTQDGLSVWSRLLADRGIKTEITRERRQFDCDMTGYLNGGIYWCIVIDEMMQ